MSISEDEINPKHAITSGLHDNWHTIVAVIMAKIGLKELQITVADLARIGPDVTIVAHEVNDILHLRIMPIAEAKKLLAIQEEKLAKLADKADASGKPN